MFPGQITLKRRGVSLSRRTGSRYSSRKEVIQPQVPLRLPCYDLVLVTDLTFGTPVSERLRVLPASMT